MNKLYFFSLHHIKIKCRRRDKNLNSNSNGDCLYERPTGARLCWTTKVFFFIVCYQLSRQDSRLSLKCYALIKMIRIELDLDQ